MRPSLWRCCSNSFHRLEVKVAAKSCFLGGIQSRHFSFKVTDHISQLKIDIALSKQQEKIDVLRDRQVELHDILEKENTWDNSHLATQLSQELSSTTLSLDYFDDIDLQLSSIVELTGLAAEEGDDDLLEECGSMLNDMQEALKTRRLQSMMSTEQDQSGCYLEIVSGAGGADAFHWTKMLATMYSKWASKNGYQVTYVDEQHDDSAGTGVAGQGGGYRRVTLRVEGGERAYGWLKAEAGGHRLVRKSPFDPTGKRHTSFAQVKWHLSGG